MKYFEKLAETIRNSKISKRVVTAKKGKYKVDSLLKAETDNGPRYYTGTSKGDNLGLTKSDSQAAARAKFVSTPSDSITTSQANVFGQKKKKGLFR